MQVITYIVGMIKMVDANQTSEKIIAAFLELVQEKGYKGTTTRAISEKAKINEVTIFRHFGNKKGIIKAAVQAFSNRMQLLPIIEHDMTWDLESDLLTIAKLYHSFVTKYEALILIGIRETVDFPKINEEVAQIPIKLKTIIINYLSEMKKRGKIAENINIEIQAMNFIWLNFGYFLTQTRFRNTELKIPEETFFKESIIFFAEALKAQ
jgi:AcrR family transcriptional regulator